MEIKTVKNELWEIAKAYPTLRGLLQKELTQGKTVGEHWATLLQPLDAVHFENVCFEFATMERPLPEPIDQLVFVIKQEVTDRAWKDRCRLEQYEKYHNQTRGAFQSVRNDKAGKIAVALGVACKEGRISKGENDKRVDELCEWEFRNGPKPDWVE